jgi:hypothetical protein
MPSADRRSRWREQTYLFRELVSVLIPPVGLRRVVRAWSVCRRRLANEPRTRERILLS